MDDTHAVHTYVHDRLCLCVDQSVSSCMANHGTPEVAEYNLLHVHVYNMCSIYIIYAGLVCAL